MLKITSFAAVCVCIATISNADSINSPVADNALFAYSTPYSWAGISVGGNLNYGQSKVKDVGDLGAGILSPGDSRTVAKPDGVSIAMRAGYDWQIGRFVAGLGGEYNVGSYSSGLSGAYRAYYPDMEVKVQNFGTVYGRLGYAFDDHWLGYGLLGYSWGKGKFSGDGMDQSLRLNGVTYGVGLAYAFTPKWSAYLEYAFTDFGKIGNTGGDLKADLQQIKLGLSYRF